MQKDQLNIQASILDRLVDVEPELTYEPIQYRLLDIEQTKTAIIRDLENLLNTRRLIFPPPPAYREANSSLLVYGLIDFLSANPASPVIKKKLRQDMLETISRFEPRLKNVTVHIETEGKYKRSLRFRIAGLMVVEPISEPISFDTYFDANRGEYVISK